MCLVIGRVQETEAAGSLVLYIIRLEDPGSGAESGESETKRDNECPGIPQLL